MNTASGIMGDYATTAAMETFTASKFDRHPTELAMLRGARLVTASETEKGRAWAESRIKQLTGGDPITARFMRENFFTFLPAFKLTVIGNHKPTLQSVDDAIRRRLNIIPFSASRHPRSPAEGQAQSGMARHPALDDRWLPRLAEEWTDATEERLRSNRKLFRKSGFAFAVACRAMRCRARKPVQVRVGGKIVLVMVRFRQPGRRAAGERQVVRRRDGQPRIYTERDGPRQDQMPCRRDVDPSNGIRQPK